MQSIIRCSIPLYESVYLLFLTHTPLHIYHMMYGPICQRQVSWTYNLHYVWDLITLIHALIACCLFWLYPFRSKSPVTEVTPLRVTAGHHTNGARRAETVIVLKPDSWRYSRITQSAKNRHAYNVMRANHGSGLQQLSCNQDETRNQE